MMSESYIIINVSVISQLFLFILRRKKGAQIHQVKQLMQIHSVCNLFKQSLFGCEFTTVALSVNGNHNLFFFCM